MMFGTLHIFYFRSINSLVQVRPFNVVTKPKASCSLVCLLSYSSRFPQHIH